MYIFLHLGLGLRENTAILKMAHRLECQNYAAVLDNNPLGYILQLLQLVGSGPGQLATMGCSLSLWQCKTAVPSHRWCCHQQPGVPHRHNR